MTLLSMYNVGQETQIDGKWVHAMIVIGSVYYDVCAVCIKTRVHLCSLSFTTRMHLCSLSFNL